MTTQGITEDDIANYLIHTPGFFERQAQLLASIQLTSPHGQRAVSLQERQMEMLRDKIKGLERRIIEMIRHGQENEAIADRLHQWVHTVLLAHEDTTLADVLLHALRDRFLIPMAAVPVVHRGPPAARAPGRPTLHPGRERRCAQLCGQPHPPLLRHQLELRSRQVAGRRPHGHLPVHDPAAP